MVYNYIKIEELVSYKYRGYVTSNLRVPKPDSFLPCAHACQPYNKNAGTSTLTQNLEASVILQLSMPSFISIFGIGKAHCEL